MTHAFVPTLPPRTGGYPKRRRWTAPDAPNRAVCDNRLHGEAHCQRTMCPRHQPENYAGYMAKHATDSI